MERFSLRKEKLECERKTNMAQRIELEKIRIHSLVERLLERLT